VKSTVEPVEGNKVKVYVEVDEDEFEVAVDDAFRKIAREVRIPGFRPGKAPRKVLEARLGKGVARGQALQDAIPEYYARAVREHDVDVIDRPDIDITDGEEEGVVAFEATVLIRPQIEVQGYGGLTVTVPKPVPDDDEIQTQLDRLRESHADWALVERSADDGDVVVIDIEGTLDGEPAPGLTAEDYSYPVGSGGIVAEVDEHLRGASAGDELEFEAAHPTDEDAELAFRVVVKEVKEKVLPELDDAFAEEASEFATMAELRDDVVRRATAVRRGRAQMAMREKAGEALAELVTDEIPEPLVASEMQERIQDLSMRLQAQGLNLDTWLAMQGRGPEDFVAELRETALTAAKVDLALRALAEQEAIEVTDEDLEGEWADVAARVGLDVDEVREQFERAEQVQAVRSDVRKRKAFEWLLEQVVVVDEDGNPVDRAALVIEPEDDSDDTEDTDGDEPEVAHDGAGGDAADAEEEHG
jgi:trigger factor